MQIEQKNVKRANIFNVFFAFLKQFLPKKRKMF